MLETLMGVWVSLRAMSAPTGSVRTTPLRGQVEAIERTLDGEHECADVLQLVAACRGALNGLMAELVEGHIWFHVLDPNRGKDSPQAAAAEELIDIVKAYLK
jgi:DNA-binding FrmR family transcriptional regulator